MLNNTIRTHLCCGIAGALILASGCHGMNRRATSNTPSTYIPPLSSITPGAIAPSTETAPVTAATSSQAFPLLPPPAPGSSTLPFGVPVQLPPISSIATTAAPATEISGPMPVPAEMLSSVAQQGDSCLPVEPEWKRTIEAQTTIMQNRLNSMESELAQNRIKMEAVSNNLTISQNKISQLNQEVGHWKGETRRLDSEMRRQQESDLKSLDELTTAVSGLISKQRMAQTQTGPIQ